jgi:hypothetical protein
VPYNQLFQDAKSVLATATANRNATAGWLNYTSSIASQESYYMNNMVTS